METILHPMRRGELRAGERVSLFALVAAQLTLAYEAMVRVVAF